MIFAKAASFDLKLGRENLNYTISTAFILEISAIESIDSIKSIPSMKYSP